MKFISGGYYPFCISKIMKEGIFRWFFFLFFIFFDFKVILKLLNGKNIVILLIFNLFFVVVTYLGVSSTEEIKIWKKGDYQWKKKFFLSNSIQQ
jgi:fatty acid desaturase